MNYTQVWQLDEAGFRRLTGVKRPVFEKMVEILRLAQQSKSQHGGRARKLDTPELLLMTLSVSSSYTLAWLPERMTPLRLPSAA